MEHSSVLVVGGGISGLTAALEAAEVGREVYLVEKAPWLGGRVSGMNHYFPKHCPPLCGLEINYQRIKKLKNLRVFTMTDVQKISGEPGNMEVTLKVRPRYITEEMTDIKEAMDKVTTEVDNPFNWGMDKTKVLTIPHGLCYPNLPAILDGHLDDAKKDLDGVAGFDPSQTESEMVLKVGYVIWATGWTPYDPQNIHYLNFGKDKDILTNVMFERLASPSGPTAGKLIRPSDGKEAKKVAFIQCAGSRDENYLPYCSGVCCQASLKQAGYVRDAYPEDGTAEMFYIDIRAGKYETFLRKVQADEKITLTKGKAGRVWREPGKETLTVVAEDIESGEIKRGEFDLVVLATGMVPSTATQKIPMDGVEYDEFGFVVPNEELGLYPVGCVKRPVDVAYCTQDATGGAIKALRQ